MRKQYNKRIENLIEKCFHECNLIGADCDIYEVLFKYKTFYTMEENELDEIYEELADRLGFKYGW